MSPSFATLRAGALSTPQPFKVSIPEDQLRELHELIRLSKIAPKTFEGEQDDRRFGITRNWLINAKAEWQKWDWRACEARINSFPNFTMPIPHGEDIFNVHFVALFSQKSDAIPILLLHGWPGSIMEFFSILTILSERYTPDTMPYHFIVPSMPGYAFSSPPPTDRDFRVQDVASIMNSLMINLGFGSGYVCQGGDIGSKVSRVMAATYAEVKAIHINFCIMPRPEGMTDDEISELEKQGLHRSDEFERFGSSYALQHATKPSTIGFVLASNPLSLLTWIGEKFLAWTDEDPPLDEILASVTLYWLTETFPRSIYPYRQLFTPGVIGVHENPDWYIEKPLGFSWFPKELAPIPKKWVAKTGNLVFYREHTRGGHFAAMEQPEVLLADIEAFIEQVWAR
ncbi:alpha/beta-hydrolase [Tothia fuscella]|uniref:Alpha/beta-hydrolase n=1 Tax=Tothia fuscella TaxID=1048955 RepID=A0A9P4TYK7_9PEZI|nr:alpha/beta-hydrolase [Tothia fuscella]